MRLAVYGGSFDPPHRAHVMAVQHVLSSDLVERVLVVPVYEHAFHKRMEAFEHRANMCDVAFSGLPNVEVSRIEATLPRPNYTVQTLQALRARYPEAELRLVVGADAVRDSSKWHRFDDVCRLAPLIVLGRVGVTDVEAPRPVLPGVSSTEIRSWLRQRDDSTIRQLLRDALPDGVLEYIDAHGLYGAPAQPDERRPHC